MSNGTEIARRCNYLVDVQLWPRATSLNPAQWLSNFTSDELPLARRLLEGFTYFSSDLVKQMFRGAFSNVSQFVIRSKHGYVQASVEWARFLGSVLIVRVTGETPSETDSGYLFARIARDFLGIDSTQIVTPEVALSALISNPRQPIVFVDDFVGSGFQFKETWERVHHIGNADFSYKAVTSGRPIYGNIFYVTVICTDLGRDHIDQVAPAVTVVPAHQIGGQYSAISAASIIWREDMRADGPAFIERKSLEIGIPDRDGHEGCWRGFNKLGLAIAFEHGWPDATIPLFYYDKNGWKPLLRKRS